MGEYEEENREFKYIGKGKLPVLSGPSHENPTVAVPQNEIITTGISFLVSACWEERLEDGRLSGQKFYKLATGRGWVPCNDMKTGSPLLQKA
jgi:hypothetical protein